MYPHSTYTRKIHIISSTQSPPLLVKQIQANKLKNVENIVEIQIQTSESTLCSTLYTIHYITIAIATSKNNIKTWKKLKKRMNFKGTLTYTHSQKIKLNRGNSQEKMCLKFAVDCRNFMFAYFYLFILICVGADAFHYAPFL